MMDVVDMVSIKHMHMRFCNKINSVIIMVARDDANFLSHVMIIQFNNNNSEGFDKWAESLAADDDDDGDWIGNGLIVKLSLI